MERNNKVEIVKHILMLYVTYIGWGMLSLPTTDQLWIYSQVLVVQHVICQVSVKDRLEKTLMA